MSSVSAGVRRFQIPIALFIASRLILIAFQAFIISKGGRPAAMPWTEPWLRWDASYYISIAENGYTFSPEIHSTAAFFPMYPALIKLVSGVTGNADSAAFLVSNLALLGTLMMVQLLAEHEGFSAGGRVRAMLYVLLYPMGLFLSAAYSESVFLLLTLACAYFARTRQWTGAIVLGMIATLTRTTGVLMVGVIWLEWAASHGFNLSRIRQGEAWAALRRGFANEGWVPVAALGIPLALVSFMVYMAVYFGSPLTFLNAHASVRGGFDLTRLGSDIIRTLTLKTIRFDIITGTGMLVLTALLLPRTFKLRGSYGWYVLLSALIPLTTGLVSYMRLMGGVFPLYFAFAENDSAPRTHLIRMSVMVFLQILALQVFFGGGFVA